jgi:hypothetical protein
MVNVSDNRSSLVFRVLDIDYKGISALDWGKKKFVLRYPYALCFVALWLCGFVALFFVALWLCGFVLCGFVLCGFVALFFVALWLCSLWLCGFVTFDVYSSPSTSV